MSLKLLAAALRVAVVCALPLGVAVTAAGLLVGVAQGATGIQDQASAQGARLAAGALALLAFGPWVFRTLTAFHLGLWQDLTRFLH